MFCNLSLTTINLSNSVDTKMTLKVAIMQPYFYPYAGYFRLFAAVDIFVALDCVQFPRRGWVHRNQISDNLNQKQWLTLPLVKSDRDSTRICDLVFKKDAAKVMTEQLRRFPCIDKIHNTRPELASLITDFDATPTQYLIKNLQWLNELFKINKPIIESSSLKIPAELKSQDRIIEIAKRVGAKHYINAPGGQGIYNSKVFSDAGLTLNFLSDYTGSFNSILERILLESPEKIAREINENVKLYRV